MKTWSDFESILSDGIRGFLEHKRALGKKYRGEEEYFRLLDRYLMEQQVTTITAITPALIDAFLVSRPYAPRTFNTHIALLRRLFDWLVLQAMAPESPVHTRRRPNRPPLRPFIFNSVEIQRLLEAAAQLTPHRRLCHRGETYRLAFAMMYGLGLRVGEVVRLCRQDVDFARQALLIRKTKFAKSRLVPLGPKLAAEIDAYMQLGAQCCGHLQPEHPLLSFHLDKTRPIFRKSISRGFHDLIPSLGLTVPPGVAHPRAHHLRHSFAVNTLLRWYRQGANPAQHLLHLSTFLGHVDPTSTAVYLTITTDLLDEAGHRFERFAAPVLQAVAP
jgi:integrase